jgi:filamentous hemagglutinin family protein
LRFGALRIQAMKTSLVSFTAAARAAQSSLPSISIKADRPQALKSVTIYWRGRKMVLMQRPQRRLSLLLCKMLRRSMQGLFGTLTRALGAGALAALASVSISAHAGIADTLPTQGAVQSGVATISTIGNQMTVKQTTDKAIIDWQSFSIGFKAGVNFIQNDANSVALNRVIGNDPSRIMGSLTANGKLFLINAAGILVGKNAKIDVAGLTASTLNITDADFTDGNMNFAADAGKVIGNVKNKGEITAHDGGNVYLIGANVENDGIINAPDGEVLLAAGRVVKLIDTTLPGVSIDVGGIAGKVTNLGKIMASAGTIGIGAALIDNSGEINASSVTKEGGRIFLRASQDLTTTATSTINADGTTGGNVVLYSDQAADIDGDVSALGNVDGNGGVGGYVETSGKQELSVMYKPRIGAGGEWYIDPTDITIIDGSGGLLGIITGLLGVITGTGQGSTVFADTITDMLNDGVSVKIVTGATGSAGGGNGDITVNASIIKSSAGAAATLTLDAGRNITIEDGAVIRDSGVAGKELGLVLNAGYTEPGGVVTPNDVGTILASNATISVGGGLETHASLFTVHGGSLTVSGATTIDSPMTIDIGGQVTINNGGTSAIDGALIIGDGSGLTFNDTASVTLGSASLTGVAALTLNNSTVSIGATSLDTDSAITVQNGAHLTATGAISGTGTLNLGLDNTDIGAVVDMGANALTLNTLHQKSGSLSGTDALTVQQIVDQTGGTIHFANVNLTQLTGALSIGSVIVDGTLNLTSTDGSIGEFADVNAGEVIAHAATGIDLSRTDNTIRSFTSTNSTSGDTKVSTVGDLSLGSITNTGRNVVVASTGKITQTGAITAGLLNVSAASGITLDQSGNELSFITGGNSTSGDILIKTDSFGSVDVYSLANEATGGNIDIEAQNAALASSSGDGQNGPISAKGTLTMNSGGTLSIFGAVSGDNGVNLSAGEGNDLQLFNNVTSAGGTVTLNTTTFMGDQGHIFQNIGGAYGINADNVAVNAAGEVDLRAAANHIGAFGGSSAGGDIYLVDLDALTTVGQISAASGDVHLTTDSGDLTVAGQGIQAQNVYLSSADRIEQSDPAAGIVASALDAQAANGIALNSTGNNVATFTATNSGLNDIVLTDGSADLTLGGTIRNSAAGGNVTISNTGNISAAAIHDGGGMVLNGTFTDNKVTLTSTAGDVMVGLITAANLEVDANAGGISQEMSNLDILTISGAMSANARDGIAINNHANATGLNHIANFSAHNTGTGDITLFNETAGAASNKLVTIIAADGDVAVTNTGALETAAGGSIGANDITLTTVQNTSTPVNTDLAINSSLNASGSVTLHSGAGMITQTAAISAALLSATAVKGITLNADGNTVSSFTAINDSAGQTPASGDIDFKNTSTGLSGGKLTTAVIKNTNGNIVIDNTGAMETDDAITATAGSVSLTASPLTINGTIDASGDINLAAGDSVAPTLLDNLIINGAVTSSGGNIGIIAGNDVTTNALVSAPDGNMTIALGGNLSMPVAPNPAPAVTHFSDTGGNSGNDGGDDGNGDGGDGGDTPPPLSSPPAQDPDPVASLPLATLPTTSTVDQNTQSTENIITTATSTPLATPTATATTPASDQTVGGSDGEFGGAKDDGKDAGGQGKSGKSLPVCS